MEDQPVLPASDVDLSKMWATDFSAPERPAWAVRALGPRPAFVDEQPRYDGLAAAIERYRRERDISDDDPLGPRPEDPTARLRHDALAAEVRAFERYRWRELEPPSIESGLER